MIYIYSRPSQTQALSTAYIACRWFRVSVLIVSLCLCPSHHVSYYFISSHCLQTQYPTTGASGVKVWFEYLVQTQTWLHWTLLPVQVRWMFWTGPTVQFRVQQMWDFAEPLWTCLNSLFSPQIHFSTQCGMGVLVWPGLPGVLLSVGDDSGFRGVEESTIKWPPIGVGTYFKRRALTNRHELASMIYVELVTCEGEISFHVPKSFSLWCPRILRPPTEHLQARKPCFDHEWVECRCWRQNWW